MALETLRTNQKRTNVRDLDSSARPPTQAMDRICHLDLPPLHFFGARSVRYVVINVSPRSCITNEKYRRLISIILMGDSTSRQRRSKPYGLDSSAGSPASSFGINSLRKVHYLARAASLRSSCKSSGRVYMARLPSGVRGHSCSGLSQYCSRPLPSGSCR